jgi:hypothetical protein
MNEDFGFSYFNFEDTHKTPTITNEAINSMIEWHDNITENIPELNIKNIVSDACHFGILRISTPKIPISTTPLAILLNIDGSSSMDEIGSDKLTKINHIKHTLKNMIHILIDKITETKEVTIYISIQLFTHDVKNLLQTIKNEINSDLFIDDFMLLTHESMHLVLGEIDRIRPWGCTNIEISLKNAKTQIHDFIQKNPTFRVAHIQLTDGQATAGKKRAYELTSYVDTSYRNIFVGYGEDHDGQLMASLGEIYPTCDYRFIDNIERTGLVYGEILYHLLYPYNDLPLLIKMSPGTKIFNWKTNQWTTTMTIPPLSSDTEKVFQIIIDDPNTSRNEVWADLYYTNNVLIPIDTAITLPSLITLPIKIDNRANLSGLCSNEATVEVSSEEATRNVSPMPNEDIGTLLQVNLSKYLLRQITQELLYLVRNYKIHNYTPHVENTLATPILIRGTNQVSYQSTMISIDELKYKLSTNIKLLVYYRDSLVLKLDSHTDEFEVEAEEEVLFIQTLIDDLQTASTNLGSTRGFMYTTARQISQGSQHTYSPYNTRNNKNTYDLYNKPTEHNHRQTSYANSDILDMMTQVQGIDHSMYVSDVENDISDSLDNLSIEPVVTSTNSSGSKTTFRVSSEEAKSPLPHVYIPFPDIPSGITRTNSINSESTSSTLFTQLVTDVYSDEE